MSGPTSSASGPSARISDSRRPAATSRLARRRAARRRGRGAPRHRKQVRRQLLAERAPVRGLLEEDVLVGRGRTEQRQRRADRLGLAEHQQRIVLERVVEAVEHARLQLGAEVDQQVPAADHVELQERRVARDVVDREHDLLPKDLPDRAATGVRLEPGRGALLGHRRERGVGIDPAARDRDGLGVDVGGEDLDVGLGEGLHPAERLGELDRDRVGLLARGRPGHPHAQRPARVRPRQALDVAVQRVELLGVAEERGDRDQEVLEQLVDLGRRVAGDAHVVVEVLRVGGRHAPLHAALHGGGLVVAEVHLGLQVEQLVQALHRPAGQRLAAQRREVPGLLQQQVELGAELLRGQHEIDAAGLLGGHRHARVLRRVLVLGDRDAAAGADRADALGPVRARARQHDADRALAELARQALEQRVDARLGGAGALARRDEPDAAALDDDVGVRRGDVDRAGQGRQVVGGVEHGQVRLAPDDLGQQALLARGHVLGDEPGRRQVPGQLTHQRAERLEPARRGADADPEARRRRLVGGVPERVLVDVVRAGCGSTHVSRRLCGRRRSFSRS